MRARGGGAVNRAAENLASKSNLMPRRPFARRCLSPGDIFLPFYAFAVYIERASGEVEEPLVVYFTAFLFFVAPEGEREMECLD